MDSLASIIIGIGAGAVAALIGFITSQKKNKLDYIELERKGWRDHIREIGKQIQEATIADDIINYLEQLKLRINAYGVCDELDIFHDGHIWVLIEQMENDLETNNYSRLRWQKKRLTCYLSCLLKHNWEKSKKEVKGEGFFVANYLVIPIGLFLEFCIFQPMIGLASSIDIFALTFVFYAMLLLEIHQIKNLLYKNEKRIKREDGNLFYKKLGALPIIIWTLIKLILVITYSYYLFYILYKEGIVLSQIYLAAVGSIIIKFIVIIMTVIFLRNIQNIHESLSQKYIVVLNCIKAKDGFSD